MKSKKRHKLLINFPSGEEYKLGFLSPCKNGFVLGTPQIEGVDASHLTIISKKGKISSHITPQTHPEDRRYFTPMTKEEIIEKFQSPIKRNLLFRLSPEQLSEEVVYITQKFLDRFDSIKKALLQKKITKKEIIYILNFKRFFEKMPELIEEFRKSPSSFIGLCKAQDLLKDSSKFVGINTSRAIIIPIENELYGIDFSLFTNFSFTPKLDKQEISNPLDKIYHSLGISQYMKEIEEKRFFEKLLSKDNHEK